MTKPNHHIFADGELSRNEGTLRIDTLDGETEYLPIESIDTLYLHGQIDFNTRALGLLNEHNVPLHIFGWKDYYRGSYLPKRGQVSGNTVVEQVRAYDNLDRRLQIGQTIIEASIHNMRANLRYYNDRQGNFSTELEDLEELKNSAAGTTDINELRSVEGRARKTYYGCFDRILRSPFTLTQRKYNPPTNEANAVISFLNGMVYTTSVSAIRKTALDPTVGFVHEPGERRFTLSLDIADIFKPILADRLLFRLVNRKQLSIDDFEEELEGCLLDEKGRMTVLEEFEETLDKTIDHPRLNRKVSFKTLVQTDVYSLKKHVLTDEPYHATERWW
ncbi:type I-B CRISPR-associated endonuclease Cas1 (plasmid) [Halobiforma lacisalsi AJ5]|uniref:CRISPR-associated endonuclease Cas1 n=1 Tax=Natronobacterium lacisalsi AJ5 TaxID=358396 RepID=M0LDY2_NATLA|nr:type I-B CRISPR-associated endonuclease Cas1b [Halobiforma lacisalsi]APX00233.1 type I-B CRISPR-associated endonuclease Cas1 [Halobiforma lacisalsi AJ5]EMA30165.1 CRISPR-associated protein Cas1 [Halobiforma lacisalsi AJ5]